MKPKTLLLLGTSLFTLLSQAQKTEKQPATGYAITAAEKGGRNWKEVRMINTSTGEELKTVYSSQTENEPLNARTKKPVAKKDGTTDANLQTRNVTITSYDRVQLREKKGVVNLDDVLNKAQGVPIKVTPARTQVYIVKTRESMDKPFSTNSAAMAYDKKHDRLYYTPMNINQLRYIDLKTGKIYYFEDEKFGTVKGYGDVQGQITRMVIASDGNGYALSNDGNHLLKFTTGKNPVITDLGSVSDDAVDTRMSIHNPGVYGGDMIADVNENLYLVSANRHVFRISLSSKTATYLGAIKGLPRGFSTNGAMVDEGSKVIVASSESTEGYYRFDLTSLEAEKVSGQSSVYNASDLANGNLAFDKKKKEKKPEAPIITEQSKSNVPVEAKTANAQVNYDNNISVYPNPATTGNVKISFNDLPAGKYQVQLVDLSGRLITTREVTVNNKTQVNDFNIPEVTKGSYLIKVVSEPNKVTATSKVLVQ